MPRLLVAGLLPLVLALVPLACPAPADPIECETAGDCTVDQKCHNSKCVGLAEGEEGEGEGDSGDVIERVCSRIEQCQRGGGSVSECIMQVNASQADMRARGTEACLLAADGNEQAWECLIDESCEDLQNGTFEETCAEQLAQSQELTNLCFSGEGEGEGEGETRPNCESALAFPEGNVGEVLFVVEVFYDAALDDAFCGGEQLAISIAMELALEAQELSSGFAAFPDGNVFEVALEIVDDFFVRGVVCVDDPGLSEVAVQLSGDEFITNPACGFIFSEEDGT